MRQLDMSWLRRWTVRLAIVWLIAVPGAVVGDYAAPQQAEAASTCGPSYSDPLTTTPWTLQRLRPELAWPLTRGEGVTVAVIDSGVSTLHPSLDGQVLSGKDYVDPSGVGDCDEVAHGTFVAGIIAGRELADSGFYGVAPEAKILPIRVLEDSAKSTDSSVPATIASAIDYAVNSGATVINLSLVTQDTTRLREAVANALEHDVVIVAAAGNDGTATSGDTTAYPAAYDGVIAVAGVDESDAHVSTSTTGDYVDVAAPGINIEGPAPQGGGFALRSDGGTSFASAYVSGVAALIRAYDPSLTAAEIALRITTTADHPAEGVNDEVGYGVVNPYLAVSVIVDGLPVAAATTPSAVVAGSVAEDPLRTVTIASLWIGICGVVTAGLILVGKVVIRRGRTRSWMPGSVRDSPRGT